jgi:hypothetical protein
VSAPSHLVASHLRAVAKIEAVVNTVATPLADSYVVHAYVTVNGQTITPTHIGNVKYIKPSLELLQFGFVAFWQAFRSAVWEKTLRHASRRRFT